MQHQLLLQQIRSMLSEFAHVGLCPAEEGVRFQRTIKVDTASGEYHWWLPARSETGHSQGGEEEDVGRRPLNTTVMESLTDSRGPD